MNNFAAITKEECKFRSFLINSIKANTIEGQ
jgi:hypothetical protein